MCDGFIVYGITRIYGNDEAVCAIRQQIVRAYATILRSSLDILVGGASLTRFLLNANQILTSHPINNESIQGDFGRGHLS